jgi:hypothetical protein
VNLIDRHRGQHEEDRRVAQKALECQDLHRHSVGLRGMLRMAWVEVYSDMKDDEVICCVTWRVYRGGTSGALCRKDVGVSC